MKVTTEAGKLNTRDLDGMQLSEIMRMSIETAIRCACAVIGNEFKDSDLYKNASSLHERMLEHLPALRKIAADIED